MGRERERKKVKEEEWERKKKDFGQMKYFTVLQLHL